MQRAMKKARKFDDFRRRTRRSFMAVALAGTGVSVGAFFFGRAVSRGEEARPHVPFAALEQARKLATGPLDDLVAAYPTFLLVLERVPRDGLLWVGYSRLVDAAARRESAPLMRHLAESGSKLPPELAALVERLQPVRTGR